MIEVIVVCYCLFYIGYKVSDICDDEGDTAQEKCQRFLPLLSTHYLAQAPLKLRPYDAIQICLFLLLLLLCLQRMSGVLLNPRITQA